MKIKYRRRKEDTKMENKYLNLSNKNLKNIKSAYFNGIFCNIYFLTFEENF
jgi:hypothetical protein